MPKTFVDPSITTAYKEPMWLAWYTEAPEGFVGLVSPSLRPSCNSKNLGLDHTFKEQ